MLKNIKIGVRLILGFLAIALITGIVCLVAYTELNKLQQPLTEDIPHELKVIERTSQLDSLAQRIRHYDHLLTESARNYVMTGRTRWKDQYLNNEPKLGSIIQEAIDKGDEDDKAIFSAVRNAKLSFTKMEYQAIRAVDIGAKDDALAIIETSAYWQLKEQYKRGLRTYIEARGKKKLGALSVTSNKVDEIVDATLSLLEKSIRLLGLLSGLAVFLALVFGFLTARSILGPLQVLQTGSQVIGKGNLNHRIPIKSHDEIGELANAFNDMTQKLKESYSGLEEKVREKTSELANKVEEIERQNTALEKSEAKTRSALADLAIAKEKIEKEKVESEALLASIGDGMFATDQNGKIKMMNAQAEIMLKCKMDEVMGKPFDRVIPCETERGESVAASRRPVALALKTGRKISTTAFYTRSDGTKFPVATTVSPIVLDKKTIGAIEIFRDITKEKEIDRMKSEFISTVSHELRTPLTVIREGVSLVMDGMLGKTSPEQRKFLDISLRDIDRLKRIIDNLLDVAKIEAGKVGIKREAADIVELVKGVADVFHSRAKNKGLEIKTDFVGMKSMELYVDKDKIIEVFTNLIGNAFKFTEEGSITLFVEDQGEVLRCGVADTGKGIAEKDLPRVFGKFEQIGRQAGGGEKGTGLGLAIAQGIVQLHGGKIWVESKIHEGTQFIFTLPKFTARDMFKELIDKGVKDAHQQNSMFSVIIFDVKNLDKITKQHGEEEARALMVYLNRLVKKSVRQQSDMLSKDSHRILLGLSTTDRDSAASVAKGIEDNFRNYFTGRKMKNALDFSCGVASFPENGSTVEDLLITAGYH